MRQRVIKIVGLAVLGLLICFFIFAWSVMRPALRFDEADIPRDLISAQFIDPDRIYAVSIFRSGAGHDYSDSAWDGETCRSMKHYFNSTHSQNTFGNPVRSQPTQTEQNIKIYAPFDGRITSASPEHIGTQVHIRSAKYPSYYARIFHMDLLPGFEVGSAVKSGEWIGTIGPRDGTDFALEVNVLPFKTAYISYFAAMSGEVFAPFAKMGYERKDFIISREYRDAHPFQCGAGANYNNLNKQSETFNHSRNRDWSQDFIFLRPDPFKLNN